jgi:peroxiredoxin
MLEAKEALELAEDFTATDTEGKTVRLSDYRHKKHVVLVFNRGLQ